MGKTDRAITLMEVLIVVTILILLTGILIPVFLRSKRSAQAAVCTSNLRQASMAWTMYTDTHNGQQPLVMSDLMTAIGDPDLLKCPLDTFSPGANSAASNQVGEKISYYIPDAHQDFRSALLAEDANHGVLACVLHGDATGTGQISMPLMDTTGLVLRARLDSSVERTQVGHICVDGGPGQGRISTRATWTLFTDVWPGPEPWCPLGSYPCP